jgi:hypothetical protein
LKCSLAWLYIFGKGWSYLVPTIKRVTSYSVLLPEFCTLMNPRFYQNAFNTTYLEVVPPNGRKLTVDIHHTSTMIINSRVLSKSLGHIF